MATRTFRGASRQCLALFLATCLATAASAQFSGVTITNTGDGDSTNDGITDGEQRLSQRTISSSPTSISGRYAWVTAADSGIFTNSSITLNAGYRVNFNVNVPGAYQLTVNTNWNGGFTTVDDGGGTATADVGALTGSQSGGTLASGTLSLPDPGSRASGSTGMTNFAGTLAAAAVIDGVSNGANVPHQLNFNWVSSCNSPGGSQISGADECAVRAGMASTLSGQTAGAYPGAGGLARVQANDGHFVTVSIVSFCGNGVVDLDRGEECDPAVPSTSCCASNCVWASAGTTCRAAAGACDMAETCPGGPGSCPADAFQPLGTVCRAASPGEVCDEEEECDGLSVTCPADGVKPMGTECRAAGGVCDIAETCDGVDKTCPADVKSTAECRAAAGVCDVAEFCNGVNNNCPANAFVSAATVCRASAGICDVAENCTGSAADCPADAVRPNGFVCDAGSGDLCDPDETCDGVNVTCPADTVAPGGTLCRPGSGDVCDPDEVCTGVANQPCPANVFAPPSTVCNAGSGDMCDPDELCPGVPAGTCAADVVAPAGTVCRPGTGDLCDPDETCSGNAGEACPADFFEPASTVCNPGSGDVCDPDEFCPGVPAGSCAADIFEPASTVCRAASGECDAVETCPGSADGACPGDAKLTSLCRASAGVCDVAESCDGVNDTCPVDAFQPSSTVCRGDAGVCDVAETCTGSSADCPADGFEPDGTSCADVTFCNGEETCQTGVCSPGTSPCAMGENCDEGSQICFVGNCPTTAVNSCVTAQKAKLVIKDNVTDSKDKLVWTWTKGGATTLADFENPTTTSTYTLCFYEGASSSLIGEATVPPVTGWSTVGTKGYKYKDTAGANDGVTKMLVKSGAAGRSKALVKGKGVNLPDFSLPLDTAGPGVVVQLRNGGNGKCLTSAFTNPKKNQAGTPNSLFKAKAP